MSYFFSVSRGQSPYRTFHHISCLSMLTVCVRATGGRGSSTAGSQALPPLIVTAGEDPADGAEGGEMGVDKD